jgi:hypothetical protein
VVFLYGVTGHFPLDIVVARAPRAAEGRRTHCRWCESVRVGLPPSSVWRYQMAIEG